ncbi:hypothetical protein BASA81_003418 [Batrachochytrium salamandrivorans]|nr:hypothetical protein BASA81_003418 [Batrachochytrium salamandrivorans]
MSKWILLVLIIAGWEGLAQPTTSQPSLAPSFSPTTSQPSFAPSFSPTTAQPSFAPSFSPTTSQPSFAPSFSPTTSQPSLAPSFLPATSQPTSFPTVPTTLQPTESPSAFPSASPSLAPIISPSSSPTVSPTSPTTFSPTMLPTTKPTRSPTPPTTRSPTKSPTTSNPTTSPTTSQPTTSPTTSMPSTAPTKSPTKSPTTSQPTRSPTTSMPSTTPTKSPTKSPTTSQPTRSPTMRPSKSPTTIAPTKKPTSQSPSNSPTWKPTSSPTLAPTRKPTLLPTAQPSAVPSAQPTTFEPSKAPSTSPTPLPTTSPSMQPSQSPTVYLPTVRNAEYNSDLTRLTVWFDVPTNQPINLARKPCSYFITFGMDVGCNAGPCELYCYWPSSTSLVIELNSQSSFTTAPTMVNITKQGNIRHASGILPNLEFHVMNISMPIQLQSPVVSISGPRVISMCGKPAQLLASVSAGTGGRVPSFVWLQDGVEFAPGNTSVFIAPKPMPTARPVSYNVRVTNWYGQSAIVMEDFIVHYQESAGVQTTLSVPQNFSVLASGQIKIQSTVSFPVECIPANKSANDIQFTYTWQINRVTEGEGSLPSLPSTSAVKLNPASLLEPGYSYRITLLVDSGLNISGTAETVVYVESVNIAAVLSSPTSFSVEQGSNKSVSISASRSCDPNVPYPACDVSAGVLGNANPSLLFEWHCLTNDQRDCSSLCGQGKECQFSSSLLNVLASPYVFYATVKSFTNSANTSNVVVTVLAPLPEECQRPTVTMLPFPAKINLGDSGEAPLRSLVVGKGLYEYRWELVNFPQLSVNQFIASGVTANQQNLVLQLGKLAIGSEYTFRLTAVLPCTLGSDSFGQIHFATNSPPMPGLLQINIMQGKAASTEFQLTANGFYDEDLPLEYMFEYKDVRSMGYSPLSSFQASSMLVTTFSQSDNITVVVRCRDALGAVTPRETSPLVQGIVVTKFELVLGALPPDTGDTLRSLLSAGGSNEDALRFAVSLAASTKSIDAATVADPAVKAWLLKSQDTMLDLVGNTRSEEGLEPSAVLLQSNALASILQGSNGLQDPTTDMGSQFLAKATGLVGQLLDDAKSAVLLKGVGGQDDPLLSQYIPTDLGAITVASLEDILGTIATSNLAMGKGRRMLASQMNNEESITNTRKRLRELVDVMLLGSVAGSAPRTILGAQMSIVCVKQSPVEIGTKTFSQLMIPAFEGSLDPPTVVTLPINLLSNTSGALASTVNIHAVRFRFNIRELVSHGALPNYTLDANAPTENITEMLSLDFFESAQSSLLHPNQLSVPIEINLTLKFTDLPKDNTTKLACGYWDEILGSWSSLGCNLTSFSLPESMDELGWQVCSCNHASDYSVWKAFVDDLSHVFVDVDLTTLSLISSLVIGIILPVLFALWIGGMYVSSRKDKKDRAMVHLGTFVSITKRKLELNDRKRRFFNMLRRNQHHHGKEQISAKEMLKKILADKELHGMEATVGLENQVRQDYFNALFGLMIRLFAVLSLGVGIMLLCSTTAPRFINQGVALIDLIELEPVLGLTITAGVIQLLSSLAASVWIVKIKRRHQLIGWIASCQFLLAVPFSLASMILALTSPQLPVNEVGTGLGLLITGTSLTLLTCIMSIAAYGFQHQRGTGVWKHLVENVGKGMVYEQSLISLITRYDPYFDRLQRISIVLAVIVGNLFAESFFFGLKESHNASIGVMIGTIFLAALVVAIPVKIGIRALFRITASQVGSPEDRVAQIFRIVAFSNDVTPGYAHHAAISDTKMLASFKRFYTAEARVELIQDAMRHQRALDEDRQRMEKRLPPKYSHEYFLLFSLWTCLLLWLIVGILLVSVPENNPVYIVPIVFAFATCVLVLVLVIGIQYAYWMFRIVLVFNLVSTGLVLGYASQLQPQLAVACAMAVLGLITQLYSSFVYFLRPPSRLRMERFPRTKTGTTDSMLQEEETNHQQHSLRTAVVVVEEQPMATSLIANREQHLALKKPESTAMGREVEQQIRRQNLDAEIMHHSARFERHVRDSQQLKQNLVLGAVLDENGLVTVGALKQAQRERVAAAEELKLVIKESRQAWLEVDPQSLSAKQLAVKSEKSVMLKFATVLAEEPGMRPRMVRKLFPHTFIYISWLCLFIYYIGGLVWVSFWVLTRDQTSTRLLEETLQREPTRLEVSVETNVILSAWLWASFLGVVIGYFVAEPLVIIMRYGFFPAILEISRPEQVEMSSKEWITREILKNEAAEAAGEADQAGLSGRKKRGPKTKAVFAATLDVACEAVETLT